VDLDGRPSGGFVRVRRETDRHVAGPRMRRSVVIALVVLALLVWTSLAFEDTLI